MSQKGKPVPKHYAVSHRIGGHGSRNDHDERVTVSNSAVSIAKLGSDAPLVYARWQR